MRFLFLTVIVTSFTAGCGGQNGISEPPHIETDIPLTETSPPQPEPGDTQIRPKDGMVMVFVPAGEFVMGSSEEEVDYALEQCKAYGTNCQRRYFSGETPLHKVVLDEFWIDQTEVTNHQYQLCLEAGACEAAMCAEDGEINGEKYPVVCVTWAQAAAYCEWAGGRLPTEAEWEYAARGPWGSRYPWGDELEGTFLNYCDSNCAHSKRDELFDDGFARSAPVGNYPQGASWVGALDMAGNVWEMVSDWNGNYPTEEQINPTGPVNGGRKVARGGSWNASPDHVRSALRTHMGLDDFIEHAGFRCAQPAP